MNLPSGHAKRLFLGFTCCIMFLVVFALLVAYNTEAESSSHLERVTGHPLTIAIPASDPEKTIDFYKKLGFKDSPGISKGLDVVCMEKEGTPYRLEIWHDRFSEFGHSAGGVSSMSFRVNDIRASVRDLKGKGIGFVETYGKKNGVTYASLKDPNGIEIELFQP
jgi:catechol 2,3-dioxygenase-like lactoylglutathione lyase family enzyme